MYKNHPKIIIIIIVIIISQNVLRFC